MCTILLEPETLSAEKLSREDSQKAVDKLMARDRSFDEPFTREELQKLFGKENERFSQISQQLNDYQLLTDREKQIVEELGLTPKASEISTPENPFFEGLISRLIMEEEEYADLPLEKKRRQMKADVLDERFRYYDRGENSGEIYVWLDNMNYASEKPGFYYVRYHNSILECHRGRYSTAYAYPVLVVQKSKLRPDQVEYMDRKCRETLEDSRRKHESQKQKNGGNITEKE